MIAFFLILCVLVSFTNAKANDLFGLCLRNQTYAEIVDLVFQNSTQFYGPTRVIVKAPRELSGLACTQANPNVCQYWVNPAGSMEQYFLDRATGVVKKLPNTLQYVGRRVGIVVGLGPFNGGLKSPGLFGLALDLPIFMPQSPITEFAVEFANGASSVLSVGAKILPYCAKFLSYESQNKVFCGLCKMTPRAQQFSFICSSSTVNNTIVSQVPFTGTQPQPFGFCANVLSGPWSGYLACLLGIQQKGIAPKVGMFNVMTGKIDATVGVAHATTTHFPTSIAFVELQGAPTLVVVLSDTHFQSTELNTLLGLTAAQQGSNSTAAVVGIDISTKALNGPQKFANVPGCQTITFSV